VDITSPLILVYDPSGSAKSKLPMLRWVPAYFDLIKKLNGTNHKSRTLSCSEDNLKRLVTALCYVDKEGLRATSIAAKNWTIGDFMSLEPARQIAVIDEIWNESTVPKVYDTDWNAMIETDGEVEAVKEPLPSSIHPSPAGVVQPPVQQPGSPPAKRGGAGLPFVKGQVRLPFKTLGIGFRVDGSVDTNGMINSLGRIMREGVTAQVLNASFMLHVKGMMVTETTIARNTSAPRVYRRAQDLFNETAVCVSRSLLGATAFPERETEGNVCLWALDTTGLKGFDTEKHQLDAKADGWRPGEKCFERIPASQVIGYVVIHRNGCGSDGGWKFRIPKDAKWTYVNPPGGAKKAYIEGELAAWATGKDYEIHGDYDFAG
jgi:hypothetical protein